MINSLVYLTRKCPRKCGYCKLRDSNLKGPELTKEQWVDAFQILKDLNVDFNLILGNETWLLGNSLLYIIERNKVPYALYTTCPDELFSKFRDPFFSSGVIDNLSCGVDYPLSFLENKLTEKNQFDSDMELKSYTAWKGLLWVKDHYPKVDCQGTITVNKTNLFLFPQICQELYENDIFCGVNFIHWDKDGTFDFFPGKEELKDFIIESEEDVAKTIGEISNKPNSIQNFEMLSEPVYNLLTTSWHCLGNPYGGPTIDADGSLRACGYRTGKETPEFSIFDLPEKYDEWKQAVYRDCTECPGCFWSYPWMFNYWNKTDNGFGKKVFTKHAGVHINEDKWSERSIE